MVSIVLNCIGRKGREHVRIIIGLVFVSFLTFGNVSKGSLSITIPSAMAADNMGQVQLILKKLRNSLVSMKDFDELEDAGMDKADVNRMRRAMNQKIKQMTNDAVLLIKAL